MAVEIHRNKKIHGGMKDGEKESVLLFVEEQTGDSINIKE